MKIIFLILIALFNLYAYEVYEDLESNLSINQIIKKEFSKRDSLAFGATESTIWIKFRLQNSNSYDMDKFLHVNMPFLDSVDLYEIDESIKESKNGTKVPIKKRDIETYHILFKIALKANSQKEIYLKVSSKTAKFIVPTFYESESEILNFISNYSAFTGGYLLIAGVLFIYNLFIYLYLRDKVYLYYIIYIASFFTHQLFYTGYINNYFHFQNYSYIVFLCAIAVTLTIIFFTKVILETKKNLKFLNLILNIYIAITLFEIVLLYTDTILEIKLRSISTVFVGIIVFIVAIASIVRGVRGAKVFLGAWSVLLITGVLQGLGTSKLLPTNFFLSNVLQIGSMTEIILFSIILAYRVNILKEERIKALNEVSQKDRLLNIQSKFATIGETLCNIEHQWRSPLSKIGAKVSELEVELDYNGVPDKKFLDNFAKESQSLIEYMSNTVSDFRNFYTPTSKAKEFYLKDSISKALSLMKFFSEKYSIKIDLDMSINPKIYGYESEFSQVILNILSNAKDIFIEREIKNPTINIDVKESYKKIEIRIVDNARGIGKDIIDKIFDPFYSQKLSQSSGLGLYMSKVIIEERMRGELQVKNIVGGTEFKIIF